MGWGVEIALSLGSGGDRKGFVVADSVCCEDWSCSATGALRHEGDERSDSFVNGGQKTASVACQRHGSRQGVCSWIGQCGRSLLCPMQSALAPAATSQILQGKWEMEAVTVRSLSRLLVFFGLPFRAFCWVGASLRTKMRGWLDHCIVLSAAASASRTRARAQSREAGTLIRG